jgi:hypothetical protein
MPDGAIRPTPAPWVAEIPGHDDAHMCRVHSHQPGCYFQVGMTWHPEVLVSAVGIERAECMANARLMAAAPDLLAALKRAVWCVGDGHQGKPAMLAAIAKAEGREVER